MDKPKVPCLGCTDRYLGCHTLCDKYNAWRDAYNAYMLWLSDQRKGPTVAGTRPWLKERLRRGKK